MEVSEVLDEKIVRIGDVLEQIALLNERITFHKKNNGNASSIGQFEEMRMRFINELRDLLREYKLEVDISVIDE